MRRFYAAADDVKDNNLVIRGEEANHIRTVLRMNAGDVFVVFDGSGVDYECYITDVGQQIKAEIRSREKNQAEPDVHVTLYQAYPKLAKMNEIVQKAVELGANAIVPFLSTRCVKRPTGQGDKLSRVVMASVKQCGRSVLPSVTDVQSFEEALEMMRRHEQLIVCWEEEQQTPLKHALQSGAKDIGIVIGSEGGFEAEEVEAMRSIGGISVTMGRRILRTETAGMAVLAACFYEKGQMQY